MTSDPGVFSLSRQTWAWLAGVAVLTMATLASTWVGEWKARLGDDTPRIRTTPLPPPTLPVNGGQVSSARGELTPDDRDAAVVRELEFLSWYAHRRQAGAPAATPLPELPETMGESESPEAADAQ